MLVSSPATESTTGMSKALPTVVFSVRVLSANPGTWTLTSYVPTLRKGNRNRPSELVTVCAVRFVSVWRALTCAPGTTAPCASVTRPLTLAKLSASWACTARADAAAQHAATIRLQSQVVLMCLGLHRRVWKLPPSEKKEYSTYT